MLKLRRLVEQDDQMPVDHAQHAAHPTQMIDTPAAPVTPVEPDMQLPAPDQSTIAADPMVMTVRDFLQKCREVDPLVCMGIESFIQKNTGAFGADQAQSEPDITFSNAIQHPAAPQPPAQVEPFSLDQAPDTLEFPG